MAKKIHHSIVVTVEPRYLPHQSSLENYRFTWAYEICIANKSQDIIQVLNRCWLITDMRGRVEEVRGVGVVGEQPLIHPGKEFVYTSFCQLPTPQGTMEGTYGIQTVAGQLFDVEIPKFILSCPSSMENEFRSYLH